MREGWEEKRIKDIVLSMGSGTTPSSSTASFYNEGTIPWINTGDLPDGPVLENKQNITDYAL